MAGALGQYSQPTEDTWPLQPRGSFFNLIPKMHQSLQGLVDWQSLSRIAPEQSSTIVNVLGTQDVPESDITSSSAAKTADDRQLVEFQIAYQAIADRRSVNATPAGRNVSRRVWLNAGADAVKWLIERLQREQHQETVIGIAETITALGTVALPIALAELESCDEAEPKYAALVGALAWMTPPQQPQLKARLRNIIDRYLTSLHIECQVAAVQLTRLLDEDEAHTRLDAAKRNAEQRLREEIEDLLDERFGE